jgi:phosphoglycolate phosphatase
MQMSPEFEDSVEANTSTGAAIEAEVSEDARSALGSDVVPSEASAEAPKKIRYRAKPKFSFPIHAKAILIDFDGTLLDTAGDIVAAANKMRGTLGFAPLEAAIIKNFIGKGIPNLVAKTLKDAVGEVGPTALKVAVASFERQYETCFDGESAPYPGVVDGLNAMKAAGFRLGCVTNKVARFTEPLLEKTGLREYFEIVVSGDTLAEKKPHPLPLQHAAEFFGCETKEMVMMRQPRARRGARCLLCPTAITKGRNCAGLIAMRLSTISRSQ